MAMSRMRAALPWVAAAHLLLVRGAAAAAPDGETRGRTAAKPCHLNCDRWVVVGNGGVDKPQYEAIDRSGACVAWFGRLFTYQKGRRISVLVSRHGGKRLRWKDVPAETPVCPVVASLDTIPQGERAWPGGYLDPINVYEQSFAERNFTLTTDENAMLFKRCPVCAGGACKHSRSLHGPSTGAAFLSYLEDQATVRQIDIYGMTFQNYNAKFHVDWTVDRLVARCCTKCRIHPASSKHKSERFRRRTEIMQNNLQIRQQVAGARARARAKMSAVRARGALRARGRWINQ